MSYEEARHVAPCTILTPATWRHRAVWEGSALATGNRPAPLPSTLSCPWLQLLVQVPTTVASFSFFPGPGLWFYRSRLTLRATASCFLKPDPDPVLPSELSVGT